jgi:hypothetical protein
MNREQIEKEAKNFAWAHQNICVNKNTGVPYNITPCKVSEMRMIPIYNEIRHAYLCGALEAVRQCIAIIRDKADEYVDWECAFGTPPSFNEEKFIQENFDIAPKATIAEILTKTETNNKIEE